MKLLTHKETKKNYNDFIDLIKSIEVQKLSEFQQINEFNSLLSKTKKNKIDWILVIELTRFLILFEELKLLEINLFKFKKILDFSLDKLQSHIKKYNQPDNTKEKIIELNDLIDSTNLFTKEKDKKYSENIKNIISIFNQLKQLNIVFQKLKNIKKSKKILVIISSIFAVLVASSAVSIPTTLHILSNNTQKNKKIPWIELQPAIKKNYDLTKFNNIPEKYYEKITNNVVNKSEIKLNQLDKQFNKITSLDTKWLPIKNYYQEPWNDLTGRYYDKVESLINSKTEIDNLLIKIDILTKEYENDINYHIKNLVEYFNKNHPLNWGLLISYPLKLQNIADESIKKIFDNHIKDFNNHFIDNFDINGINSFQHISSIYKKINDFINQINSQYWKVENLKLRHKFNESDFKLLLSMFEEFKNNPTNNHDFYITKTIQNYIDYFGKVDFFPLVVDRLTYFKNNFDFGDSDHTMQWFITKDKKYTLNPENEDNIEWRLPYMRDSKFGLIHLSVEYISKWLKNYDEWMWVINDEPKIESIDLGNVKMFNHHKDFKDNYIAETFKDYENFNINVLYWKFSYPKYDISKADFELEKQFNKLAEIYGKNNFKINNWDSEFNFSDNPLAPKLDFDLYKKYTLQPNRTAEVSRPTLYYELLTEQPNYFSNFEQNSITSLKIKATDILKTAEKNFDYPKASKLNKYNNVDSSIKEDEEVVKNQIKQWLQNWITFLPKYISKNWDTEQIIKALSFFITSNVNYMYFNYSKAFNTDGNNFYNPSSLFETDRTLQCYGYSQNLSMSLSLLNIPVRIVSGTMYGDINNSLVSSGGHAWNEVFVDNKWVSVDLTFADYQDAWSDFNSELNLNEIFLDRDAESRRMFRLYYTSYITTIIKYLNKDENGNYVHNYVDLPTHYSSDPETELKWENMLPILKAQYK